jgi:hypothetical protein
VAVEGTTEDHLAWEARQRRSAAIAAGLAALFTFVGTIWRFTSLSGAPRAGFLGALDETVKPGEVGSAPSQRTETFRFYDDNAVNVLLSSIVTALGYLALGWALTYLAAAVRNRRPEFPKVFLYLPIVVAVLQALSTIVSTIATGSEVSDFLAGPKTVDAAHDIFTGGLAVFAQVLGFPGSLGLAAALVVISLNAMRVGLLTRFMGVIGMISGVLVIIPIGGPLPIVQAFWLVMLALLFLQRSPGGDPPAWKTGRAEPWPTRQQMLEQQGKVPGGAPAKSAPPPAADPVGSAPERPAHVRSKKKKRRR